MNSTSLFARTANTSANVMIVGGGIWDAQPFKLVAESPDGFERIALGRVPDDSPDATTRVF